MIKNTKLIQLASVSSFAAALGFFGKQDVYGNLFFKHIGSNHKVSFNRMVNWHNGNVGRVKLTKYHTYESVGNMFPTKDLDQIAERFKLANELKLVEHAYLKFSKKNKKLLVEKHIIQLTGEPINAISI